MSDTPRHSRRGLYLPFIIVGLALAGWTGWWFQLASQVEQRLLAQEASMRAAGWTVRHDDPSISGWPFRVRLQLDHARVGAPSGHAVSAPALVAEANAWQPTKWVVIAPDGLVLTRAAKGEVAVRGDAIRMSVHGLTQTFPNIALELVNPVFTAHPGAEPFPIARASLVQLHARPHRGAEASRDVDVLFRLIEAQGRRDGPVEGITRDGALTAQIEAVIEKAPALRGPDAAGVFSAWSAAGGRFGRVRGEGAAGRSRAELSSESLAAGPDGRLYGEVALKTRGASPAIAGLARSGDGAVNRAGAAGAAAATAVAGDELNLTLIFRDGRTWLGPFSVAPAPKLF